jgi:hypothetical protein
MLLRCLAVVCLLFLTVRAMIESNSYGAEHITYEEVERVFEQCPFYCGNILLGGFQFKRWKTKKLFETSNWERENI